LADFLEPAGVTTPLPVSVGRNITENDEYSDNEDPEVVITKAFDVFSCSCTRYSFYETKKCFFLFLWKRDRK